MNKQMITTPNAPAAIGPYSQAVKTGLVKFTGNPAKFVEFMSYLVDLNQYFWFNIVTP